MPTQPPTDYDPVARTLHWTIALAVLAMIPLGLTANTLSERLFAPGAPLTEDAVIRVMQLFSLHKTLGVTIFLAALFRLGWALTHPRPGLLNPDRRIEAFLARTTHILLYAALLAVPLAGWIEHAATSGLAPILWPLPQDLPFVPKDMPLAETFGSIHTVLAWTLTAAILLHVAGALKHHLVDRDATLRRMLPGRSGAPSTPRQPHGPLPFLTALAILAAAIAVALAG